MKILQYPNFPGVVFVDPIMNMSIKGSKRQHQIHTHGFHGEAHDFDYDLLDAYLENYEKIPNVKDLGTWEPTQFTKAGVEVVLHEQLFANAGWGFYALLDGFGLDSTNGSSTRSIRANRRKTQTEMSKYLGWLYDSKEKQTYQKRLIEELQSLGEPANRLFQLQILGKTRIYRTNFSEINLEEVTNEAISIDIDSMIADKFLALYAMRN